MSVVYDQIGGSYAMLRRPDPRIATAIWAGLGKSEPVLNVGAGAGSYEPSDRKVIAVEPSSVMIRQRPEAAAPVVQAVAEALPFRDGSFEAAMALLTIHHWSDKEAGLAELRRVARGPIVVLTHDIDTARRNFWLARDYVPELLELERAKFSEVEWIAEQLGATTIEPVPVPHDCQDGFLGAYWRRPEAYLDARVREAISFFRLVELGPAWLARLANDLSSGAWEAGYGHLRDEESLDLGYRLVIRG
jgi:SAM-dependent methyltransferase